MDNKRKKSKVKRNRPLFLIVLVILLYVSWILISQRIKLQELTKQEEELQKKVEQLKEEEQRLAEERELLNDPKYIERVARERLKMVKPNEIIYIDHEKAKFQE